MGNVNVTGTHVGSDGTGYFQGDDGRYYYGNLQNGYLTESLQSQAARAAEESSSVQSNVYDSSYDDYDPAVYSSSPEAAGPSGISVGSSILCVLLSIKLICWFFSFVGVFLALAALFFGTLYAWPYIFKVIFFDFVNNIRNPGRLLVIVAVFALLAYFIFSSYTILFKRVLRLKRFLIVSGIAAVVLTALCSRGRPEDFFVLLLIAVSLLALPTLLLCFFEHLATKERRRDQRWFITRASKLIARYFVKKSTGMVVYGSVIVVLGILFTSVDRSSAVGWFLSLNFISMGALLAAMGIIDKVR